MWKYLPIFIRLSFSFNTVLAEEGSEEEALRIFLMDTHGRVRRKVIAIRQWTDKVYLCQRFIMARVSQKRPLSYLATHIQLCVRQDMCCHIHTNTQFTKRRVQTTKPFVYSERKIVTHTNSDATNSLPRSVWERWHYVLAQQLTNNI